MPLDFLAFSTVLFYGGGVKADTTSQMSTKTKTQNLVRNRNGRYYARLYLNGKEIWKSLKTEHYSVAQGSSQRCRKGTP